MILLISVGLLAAFISYYSFRGGIWLWMQMGTSISFSKSLSKSALVRGAGILIFGMCLIFLYLCMLLLDAESTKDNILFYASMVLAFTLAYNCGYLFSIFPSRRSLARYQGLLCRGLAATLWGFLAPAAVFASSTKSENSLLIYYFFAGVFLYSTGFFLWEQLRQANAFNDSIFTNLLWKLSVAFVIVSALVMAFGIAAQLNMLSALIPLVCVMLILLSLIAYLAGLLKVLSHQ